MLAKLWSQDRKIKKLASFSTFDELKKKAVEQGVCPSCPNEDVKVFLEDGTEVEETVFQCLLESSVGQLGGVFIVSTATSIGGGPQRHSSPPVCPSQFLTDLVLPWNSLSEATLTALNAQKTLSHSKYCELVRMIVAAMEKVAPRPSFSQCGVVANYVGPMYPVALADPLTSASQSATFEGLARKLEIRIENSGRGGKRVAEELAKGKLKRATPRTTYGCPDWQPPLSSSASDYEEAKKTLAEESIKSEAEQNVDMQTELMMSAFPAIRLCINTKNNRASDVRKEWPLLFTRRHFLSHFKRLTTVDIGHMFESQNVPDYEMLFAFLRHSVKPDDSLVWLLNAEKAEKELGRPVALFTGLFPLMCLLFKEKMDCLFRVTEATVDIAELIPNLPLTPLVLALGRSIFDCTCIIVLDGTKCFEGLSFLAAMELLYAAYYCLNLEYSGEVPETLEFIQRMLVNMHPEEGTRQPSRKVSSMHPKVRTALKQFQNFKQKCLDCVL